MAVDPEDPRAWSKSSFSGTGNCVEVQISGAGIRIRDSKRPDEAQLRFSLPEWEAFLNGVRGGEFDLPS